ncbi:hypothetical protein [Escherichia coli]|uniref:hypothetical protein n=1 Tax=Escherichia coli TaxID=562 RepID=UPI00300EFE3F
MYSRFITGYWHLQSQSALLAHLCQLEGELAILRAWQRLGITPVPEDEDEPSPLYSILWDVGEALGWLLYDLEMENVPAPGTIFHEVLDRVMSLGHETEYSIWADSISTGKRYAAIPDAF